MPARLRFVTETCSVESYYRHRTPSPRLVPVDRAATMCLQIRSYLPRSKHSEYASWLWQNSADDDTQTNYTVFDADNKGSLDRNELRTSVEAFFGLPPLRSDGFLVLV